MTNISVNEYINENTSISEADGPLFLRFCSTNEKYLTEWFYEACDNSVILGINADEAAGSAEGMPMLVYAEVTWDHVPVADQQAQLDYANDCYKKYVEQQDARFETAMTEYIDCKAGYDQLVADGTAAPDLEVPLLPSKPELYPAPVAPAPDFILQRTTINDHYIVSMVETLCSEGYTLEEKQKLVLYNRLIALKSGRAYAQIKFVQRDMEQNPPIRLEANIEQLEAEMAALEAEVIEPDAEAEV